MKNLLLILVMGLVSSPLTIDPDLQPYFDEWLSDCGEYNIEPDLSTLRAIQYSDTVNYHIASYSNENFIIINERFRGDSIVKVLLYHDLGKEILKFPEDTAGVGIMSYWFDPFFARVYMMDWNKYKKRYFKQ